MVENHLKIISDISCSVSINNEMVGFISQFEMKDILLPHGDYLIQLISDKNPKYRIVRRITLDKDTLVYVEFAKEMKSHPEWIDYSDLKHTQSTVYCEDVAFGSKKQCGIINTVLNTMIIPERYDSLVNVDECEWYSIQEDTFNFYNKTTNDVRIDFEYHFREMRKIEGYFLNDLMCVAKNEKYGFVNYYGEEVIPLIYDSASDFWGDLARVKKGEKWGYVDTLGNVIVDFIYDSAANFHEGLARVVKNNLYGFIDSSGKEVIPCQYYYACDFKNGSAVVRSEKYAVINKKGELIYPMDIEDVIFEDDVYIIARNGDCFGVINRDGSVESPFINSYFDIATVIYPPVDDCKTLNGAW